MITGSAVVLRCCNGHSKINRKIEISTPYKIATPLNYILKLGTRDYVWDISPYANSEKDQFGGGFSSPQVKPRHWRTRLMAQTTCFRARRCLWVVRVTGDAIWGETCPNPLALKMGVNRQFQA